MHTQLDTLFTLIDKANSADPQQESDAGGSHPRALIYGQRMSKCLNTVRPDAPLELQIAARAQHICRWQITRDSYPGGRTGYLQWRSDLARHHAELTAGLMQQLALDEDSINRVQALLQKKNLKRDEDTQTLEDVACLVFLEHYFSALASKHSDEKMISIVAKTWRKMSAVGHEWALALDFAPAQRRLIEAALETGP